MAGIAKSDIDTAFATSESIPPDRLKDAGAFLSDVLHLFHPAEGDPTGIMLPWPRLMQKVQLRSGEFSIWTGISGHGKSMLLGQAMLSAAEQGERVCIASLEMKPGRTLQRMVRQALAKETPISVFKLGDHGGAEAVEGVAICGSPMRCCPKAWKSLKHGVSITKRI